MVHREEKQPLCCFESRYYYLALWILGLLHQDFASLNAHFMYDMRHTDKSGTCLSKCINKLIGQVKCKVGNPNGKAVPWNPITNICRLYVLQKHHILFHPEDSLLNQRSEFKAFPFICSRQSKFPLGGGQDQSLLHFSKTCLKCVLRQSESFKTHFQVENRGGGGKTKM